MADDNKEWSIKANCSFPSQLDPFSLKKTEGWGLGLARAIESEWFYRPEGGRCQFYTTQADFILRRQYAKGIQPMNKYFSQLGANGDKSYLNLPKKPVSIIPKLVAIVCNGMAERDYSIRANAIDPVSQENRIAYRRQKENDMYGMPVIKKAQEAFGINVASSPVEDIPENNDELELHMQLEYKPSIEISEELAIDSVFQEYRFKETIERMNKKDLTILGVAWAKHRFVPERGIMLEYVDPEYKIQSYSEDPFFRDTFYDGEFKPTLTSDILIEYPWINDDPKTKEQLQNSSNIWYNYHSISQNERIKGMTNLLYFTYKTTREKISKIIDTETGGKEVSEYTEEQNEKKDYRPFKKATKVEEIEFEGVYVLGTDILLKWEVAENMSRPNSNKQKVIGQYVGVAPNREKTYYDSLVARMMGIDDDLQVIRLKTAQMVQRMNSDGYFFDVDGFAEIDLGDGVLKYQDVLDMLFQTGSSIGRTIASDGSYNNAKLPVTELKSGGNIEKIDQLRQEREYNFNLLRDVIGLNNASDASNPEKDSLVGVQKLAAANSNVATRDILYGGNDITQRIAQAVTYRIADVLKYHPLKQDLIQKIGATAALDLEAVKDLHLYDFGIYIELALDDEQRAMLEADLSKAIDKGYIDVTDKYKVLNIKNLKLAVQYLSILIKKRQREQEAVKQREFQAQADQNIRAAQGAEQAKQLTAKLEGEVKSQVQQIVNEGLINKEKVKGEEDRNTLTIKIQGDKEIAQINGTIAVHKQNEAEAAKDERTRLQATQQSKMKEQAQKEGSAIDFVAENAGLEEFTLE